MFRYLLFSFLFCAGIDLGLCRSDYYVQKLVGFVFRGYEKTARPASSDEKKTNVSISLSLLSINNYDAESHDVTIMTWMSMSWRDGRLSWDKKSYGDIHKLNIPPSQIWVPDVVLTNSVDSFAPQFPDRLVATIQHTGDVFLVTPSEFKTRCTPTDDPSVVTCPFKFLSWTYDGNDIGLTARQEGLDMSDYVESPGFKVIKRDTKVNERFYPCCPEPYPDVMFTIDVKVDASSASGKLLVSMSGLSACLVLFSILSF